MCHSERHSQTPPPWLAQVLIVRSTTITLTPSPETDVSLVYRGFIHPLLPGGPGGPGAEDVAVWARAQRLHVLARMARGPDTENMVRVPGTPSGLFMVQTGAGLCVQGGLRRNQKQEMYHLWGKGPGVFSCEHNLGGILKQVGKVCVIKSDSPEEEEDCRRRVGALRGQGAERAGESEAGAMSSVVIPHQSIPFSNKSTENQYKLNNQVQYRRNLTKHNDKTAHMYLCAKNTWEKWGFPWAKPAVCWWWPRMHMWRKTKCKGRRKEKSTCGVACPVLPLSLFCSLRGL